MVGIQVTHLNSSAAHNQQPALIIGGCHYNIKRISAMSEFKVGDWVMLDSSYVDSIKDEKVRDFISRRVGKVLKLMGDGNVNVDVDGVVYWSNIQYLVHTTDKSVNSCRASHPHAELMAQYAEDAKTNAKPWELWEVTNEDDHTCWNGLRGNPVWHSKLSYRRKPKTKLIHGVEVPDISFAPKDGEPYFFPEPTHPDMFDDLIFDGSDMIDQHNCHFNLCYPYTEEGKQAAILHAKSMLGIK